MTKLALYHPAFATSGGAEFLVSSLAKLFREAGLDLSLVTMTFDQARWGSRFEGIPVREVPKRHWQDLFTFWDRLGKLRRRARAARVSLRDAEVVLAYNHPCSAMLGYLNLPARKVWQCNEPPRGLHLKASNPRLTGCVESGMDLGAADALGSFAETLKAHEGHGGHAGRNALRRAFDVEMVGRLDEIFAISEFSRDNARRIYGRCAERVVYPVVRFPEGGRTRSGLDRSGLKVLVHSRLEVYKNIDTVIRGFARFRERVCPSAELHVVGEGEQRSRLESLARELLGEKGWTFHGFLPDAELRAVYDACDVFALLTLDEPFGMVYPEAAAKGLLMVGPDHGGPLEILDGGRLGWVCDPFDSEALAGSFEAIWKLEDAEVDRRRIEADEACRSRFSEAAIRPILLSFIQG